MVRRGHRRRRILRWEDERFERSRGIRTDGLLWPSDGTVVDDDANEGNLYAPEPVRLTRWWLRALPAAAAGATFVDMGSGKGRVLFVAAEHGFRRALGVGFVEELHADAMANVGRFRAPAGAPEITPLLCGAGAFQFPPDPLVVHFNNPFSERVMERVIAALCASYESRPRPIFAVYQQAWREPERSRTRNVELLAAAPLFDTHRLLTKDRPSDRLLLGPYRADLFETAR